MLIKFAAGTYLGWPGQVRDEGGGIRSRVATTHLESTRLFGETNQISFKFDMENHLRSRLLHWLLLHIDYRLIHLVDDNS